MKKKQKIQRQGLETSIKELRELADELEDQWKILNQKLKTSIPNLRNQRMLVSIVNKTSESDTWEFEK